MKKILVAIFVLIISSAWSYSEINSIEYLVDTYNAATNLQRKDLEKSHDGEDLSASGVVNNVEEYNFFDESTDTKSYFYRVVTNLQKTKNKTPYQVLFLYSDIEKVKGINRYDFIEREGKLFRISDEGLWISVWINAD